MCITVNLRLFSSPRAEAGGFAFGVVSGAVVDGLGQGNGHCLDEIAATIPRLEPRWFVLRDAQERHPVKLLKPRTALRGPMTAEELERARQAADALRAIGDGRQPGRSLPTASFALHRLDGCQ